MLLQEVTPDTTIYMITGYTVIFGVMLLYVISLLVRRNNLQKDLEVLETMEANQE